MNEYKGIISENLIVLLLDIYAMLTTTTTTTYWQPYLNAFHRVYSCCWNWNGIGWKGVEFKGKKWK